MLACSCALRACAVTWLCAYVLTSLKCLLTSVLRACVLMRFCFWRAPVLACSRVYQAWFFYVLTCLYGLFSCWAQISYVYACLSVSWTLFVPLCSTKILILKTLFHSEKYLEPTWTSLNAKMLHHRFLLKFYTHFIFIDTSLKTYILKPI